MPGTYATARGPLARLAGPLAARARARRHARLFPLVRLPAGARVLDLGCGSIGRDLSLDHWRKCIDINLWGVIYGTTAAYAAMLRQGSGHIVNTASAAGLIGEPGLTPYSVTKSAVVALSTALRAEADGSGVRVSVVCPGFVDTAIYENAIGVKIDKAEFLAKLPVRLVSAADAARAILRGVERNEAIIVFPFYARLLWWLTRINPSALAGFHRRTLANLRATRDARARSE